jgi:hypothetical protein
VEQFRSFPVCAEYKSCMAYILLFKNVITKCNHTTKRQQNRHLPFNKTKNQLTSPITHIFLTCVHYLPKYKRRIFLHQHLEYEGVGSWSRIQLCILYTGIFLKIWNLKGAILHSANTVRISTSVCTRMSVTKCFGRQLIQQLYSTEEKAFVWQSHTTSRCNVDTHNSLCVLTGLKH